MTADPQVLFTRRARSYSRFIKLFRYRQGLRAYLASSDLLQNGVRVLEAGCGTGALTLAFCDAMRSRRLSIGTLHAFDLTPAMLDILRESELPDCVELAQADVLALDTFRPNSQDYDLVISASMLEYVPRAQLPNALNGLQQRLVAGGRMLLFITKDNWLMRPMIGRWWKSNLYTAIQLHEAFRAAGFRNIQFRRFPLWHRELALWGHIVEAYS